MKRLILTLMAGLLPLSLSALGADCFSGTGVIGGFTDTGEVCVTVGSGTLSVTVSNLDTSVTNVPELLDGFDFTLSGSVTSLSLTGVTPAGILDCQNTTVSGNCTLVTDLNAFVDQNNSSGTCSSGAPCGSPYEWGTATSGTITLGSSSNTFAASLLDPGSFSGLCAANTTTCSSTAPLQPAAIVDLSSLMPPSGVGKAHDDLLLGPVMFTYSFAGTVRGVTGANTYWGTDGAEIVGTPTSVPEPTSLLLLGTVLLGTAVLVRRKVRA